MKLIQTYYDMSTRFIDEKGIYPHQLMWVSEDDTTHSAAVTGNDKDYFRYFCRILLKDKPKELMYGLDRFTKEGQGTTLNDLLAGAYYDGASWRPYIIEYQHDPRIVKEINWDNKHWHDAIFRELRGYFESFDAHLPYKPQHEHILKTLNCTKEKHDIQ